MKPQIDILTKYPARMLLVGLLASLLPVVISAQPVTAATGESVEDKSAREKPLPEMPLILDPFTVQTTRDDGYLVANSVSATRVNTAIQDTPMAINVITRNFIDDIGAFDLKQALQYTSGVVQDANSNFFSTTSGDSAFTIRGLAGAAVFRDGFTALGMVDASNIERIEVVKGPASVFYGNASPGGIINYVTKQPIARQFGNIRAMVGSYGFYRGELDINLPLVGDNSVILRLNAATVNAESFRRFEKKDVQFVSPALKWQINDKTQLTTSAEFYNLDNVDPRSVIAVYNAGANVFDVLIPGEKVALDWNAGGRTGETTKNKITSTTVLDHNFSSDLSTRLSFNYWETQDTFVANISATISNPAAGFNLNVSPVQFTANETYYALRNDWLKQINALGMDHKLIFGLEYSSDDSYFLTKFDGSVANILYNVLAFDQLPDATFDVPSYGSPKYTATIGRGHTVTDVGAAYFSDQISMAGGRITALLGVRYDKIEQTSKLATGGSAEKSRMSPQASLLGKINKNIGVYVSYSTSLTPNGLSSTTELFEPQRGIGMEGGFKFQGLEGKLLSTFSLFRITRENIPTSVSVVDPITGAFVTKILLSGEQTSKGFDMDLGVAINDHWQVIGNYSNYEAVISSGRSGATPTSVSPDEGLPTSRAPHSQGSLWSRYTFGNAGKKLTIGIGVTYSDKFVYTRASFGNPSGKDTLGWAPSYYRGDLALDYVLLKKPHAISFGLKVTNLFDARYIQAGAGGGQLAAPRSYMGVVKLDL